MSLLVIFGLVIVEHLSPVFIWLSSVFLHLQTPALTAYPWLHFLGSA